MSSVEVTERELLEQFLNALRDLPGVRAEVVSVPAQSSGAGSGPDLQVHLCAPENTVCLQVETKKTLYPRDVRQLLWKLSHDRRGGRGTNEHETVSMLVAESISPGARELLRDERVGYYDTGGSLFVPARGVYVYVDMPPPKAFTGAMRTLFSKRRTQVSHTLLTRHEHWFSVEELAQQAGVSRTTASQVLRELERFDWLASRGQGPNKRRRLQDPGALLDAWARELATMRRPAMRHYYVPRIRADNLIQKVAAVLGAHGVKYAVTHDAAGQRYAPFLSSVSQVRCRLLRGPAANQAIHELGARAVNEGINLAVIESPTAGELMFRQRLDGIWLASPIQVYLDLVGSEGRSKELGEHLRRERIGF